MVWLVVRWYDYWLAARNIWTPLCYGIKESRPMVRIDWKRFIYNHILFGYGRGARFESYGDDRLDGDRVNGWIKVMSTWPWYR